MEHRLPCKPSPSEERAILLLVLVCSICLVLSFTHSLASETFLRKAAACADKTIPIVQITQNFDEDPGWEGVNNRVEAENDGPTIKQDFGYKPNPHAGAGAPRGEIGGVIWRTRTPAYYAMKLKPLGLSNAISASGKLVIMPGKHDGEAYVGFFNSTRQGWRPWNSMALRIGRLQSADPPALKTDLDYMSATWKAGGFETGSVPADGKPHQWHFEYDPLASVPKEWLDPALRGYIGEARRGEAEILAAAKRDKFDLTAAQLHERLTTAEHLGFITFHTRRGIGWEIRKDPTKVKGKITCTIDDRPATAYFLDAEHRSQPMELDRFGIFNFQLPGNSTEIYLSDLVVNGQKIDLSNDPGWEASGNQTQFIERDFHAKHDFGFSSSNHAGKAMGEIGGTLWRTEAVDPLHGYYADAIGHLTLDDPISFSGSIAFTDGATDAGMFFGYFNTKERAAIFEKAEDGAPMAQSMGFTIDGPTRIGYNFSGQIAPTKALVGNIAGPVFLPDGKKHVFTFSYDPKANNARGSITCTLDNHVFKHDLTPEQRAAGSTFDRFGMMNVRRGGKFVTVYLDDLTYSARREADQRPARHQQTVTKVPYPQGGRKY